MEVSKLRGRGAPGANDNKEIKRPILMTLQNKQGRCGVVWAVSGTLWTTLNAHEADVSPLRPS